jgi:N-acetylneuraminic acid mutarotase
VNNKWVRTGEMKTARRGHAATLLRDGRVLITGGYDGTTATSALNKAETYDPATGVWTNTTGTLIQARRWHTSTLLNNDKVLIVGGGVSSGVSRVVELFDPIAGTFTATGSLQLPRQGHTTTLLPNGSQVLVVGRNNADNTFNAGVDSSRTTEIYDVTAGTWSAGPVMTYGRDSHTATLVGNSNVLLVSGGYGAGTDKVESLDLTAPILSWTTNSPMSVARALHTSTYIPSIDKVLVMGGYNATSQMLLSTELFTLNAITPWSNTGNKELTLARAMHTSTLLSNGNVLVVGTYYTTSGTVSNTAEIWSP